MNYLKKEIPIGEQLPTEDKHAVSVSLPTWESNVGYEEGVTWIVNSMKGGYPRFVWSQFHRKLFEIVKDAASQIGIGAHSESEVLLFAEHSQQLNCLEYLTKFYSVEEIKENVIFLRLNFSTNKMNHDKLIIYCMLFPKLGKEHYQQAKLFWQHTGEGIYSRQVEYLIKGGLSSLDVQSVDELGLDNIEHALDTNYEYAINFIRTLLPERASGEWPVYLYPSGMNAIYHTIRNVGSVLPGRHVLYGFSYIDTIRLHEKIFGCDDNDGLNSVILFPTETTLAELGTWIDAKPGERRISTLFCEFCSNPLLNSPDLTALKIFCRQRQICLIVDDTFGMFVNSNVLPNCDILVTSLTKAFSGASNVMAGCAVLNCESTLFQRVAGVWLSPPRIWHEDMAVLLANSADFEQRFRRMNTKAEVLVKTFISSPFIKSVLYPKILPSRINYEAYQNKRLGGYGNMISLIFHREDDAIKFYNHVQCAKGPSLGANFTLLSPYLILAHYEELERLKNEYYLDSYLLRLSVGDEPVEELVEVFSMALASLRVRNDENMH